MWLRRHRPDIIAIIALALLWLVFFWRLFTPIDADRVAIVEGDFSNQFVAFGAYQYSRFEQGSVPLWNPYNNGGLPFIADSQAAVFYPPRLITIALSSLSGSWQYNALQMEMTVHILSYTLFMYALVRRMTLGKKEYATVVGAFVAAIIAGYGGFMSGYPTQQLALLEAGIWLPVALLGVLETTRRQKPNWPWLMLTGFSLGLSWLAGHPQTSWFSTYLVVAYLGCRIYKHGFHWGRFIGGTLFVGTIALGIAAVQLLPSIEYLTLTTRAGMGFTAKSGGFPIQDVLQFLFPSVVSVWSPLFVGVSGLALAVIAFVSKERERLFWGAVALIALALSLGGNSGVFHAFYNIVPGLRYFRGQERAAYLVVNCLAILAGLGVATLSSQYQDAQFSKRIKQGLTYLTVGTGLVTVAVFIAWIGNADNYSDVIGPIIFSTIIAGAVWGLVPQAMIGSNSIWLALLALLVSFELFTVNIDNANFHTIPSDQQPIMVIPPLVKRVQEDTSAIFRVDGGMVNGYIGIYGRGNSGSIYNLQDIRGISPLFLDGPHALIQRELPPEVAWELFAVKYVFTDWEVLPVESELIARDYPDARTLNLHRLTDPRPFVLMVSNYEVLGNDQLARQRLVDPGFDARSTIILAKDPGISVPVEVPRGADARVTEFSPEHFTIQTSSTDNVILSISLVDYPGWRIEIDGYAAETIRAYGALTALPLSAGEHTVSFTYDSPSYRLGAVLSLVTWGGLGILVVVSLLRSKGHHHASK